MESDENTSSEQEYTVLSVDGEKKIKTEISGEIGGTKEKNNKYRMTFHENGEQISPWHDIPLKTEQQEGGIYNFICEIPKYTKPKMEINTKEKYNPIEQDMKKEKPREYHGPIYWNYGCLPQTWENPDKTGKDLKYKGDNDPLDVVEIGDGAMEIGEIAPVKVLGILAMIDEGEVDWKVIAIRTNATLTREINGEMIETPSEEIDDIGKVPTEVLSGIREWFRWYKTPDKKPLNKFGLNEEFKNRKYAIDIIKETNEEYENIVIIQHTIKHGKAQDEAQGKAQDEAQKKAQELNLTSARYRDLGGGMRKRRTSRRTKRKRKSLKKTRRTKRKRNTLKKSRRTRRRTRRR